MSIQSLATKGGTDWSQYTVTSKASNAVVAKSTTLTILDVTGEGYLSFATAMSNVGTLDTIRFQVIIDGVIKEFSPIDTVVCGYVPPYPSSGTYNPLRIGGSGGELNHLDNNKTRTTPLANPLFFKKSLTIKAINTNATYDYSVYYGCQVGVK